LPAPVLTNSARISLFAFHSRESSLPLHARQTYQPLQYKSCWLVMLSCIIIL
jgi:hypothetical protein